jgi:hypothetical protein
MASLSATDLLLLLVIAAAGAYWLLLRPAGSKVEAAATAGTAKAGSSEADGDSRDFAAAMKKAVSVRLSQHERHRFRGDCHVLVR